jgi:general secretion pathway protein B
MSYILDALRRAQAERDRGQVPGLNAQPLAAPAVAVVARPGMWLGLGMAAAVVLLALLVALLLRTTGSSRSEAPAVAQRAASPKPSVAKPAPLPIVVSAPPVVPAPRSGQADKRSAGEPAAAAAAKPSPLSSLSAEQRREMPALVISGSVWSESATSRFVVVNGQVVHEGEPAAPGVVLERIGPKSALVRWRGLRIEIAF